MVQQETDPRVAQKRAILCVDDDLAVLSALRRLFRSEPYEVLTAKDAAQALASLRTRKVDVIISDERMPFMTGSEFLADVRQRWPRIGRIILTAYPRESAERNVGAEIDLLLQKPWDDDALKLDVRRLMQLVHQPDADDDREVG